jgi:hypothetical protein
MMVVVVVLVRRTAHGHGLRPANLLGSSKESSSEHCMIVFYFYEVRVSVLY